MSLLLPNPDEMRPSAIALISCAGVLAVLLVPSVALGKATGEETGDETGDETAQEVAHDLSIDTTYEDHWLRFGSKDDQYAFQVQNRIQFRYAYPFDPDPRSIQDLGERRSSFMIRRARFKLQGHTLRRWLTWRFQYDWSQPVMRDFSLNISKFQWLQFQIGRRKVLWNEERVTSSGAQQFVNRSILNDVFTVDRQQGIQVFGRLFPDTWADFTYHLGIFSGVGVGFRENDDQHMMYSGKLQWNALGGEMDYSQSDVEGHLQPNVNLAVGAAHNISRCTAFETDARSCRPLPTVRIDGSPFQDPAAEAEPGQFELNQIFFEFRLKWMGWFAKHEYHWKQVVDRTLDEGQPGQTTDLHGSLYQVGYFPHYLISAVPAPLEVAARYVWVNPALNVSSNFQTELSGVINWFFAGHNNKLSFEVSRLTIGDPAGYLTMAQNRVRTQWDASF